MKKRNGLYKKEAGVYRFQNIVTGRFYIGSTVDIYKRHSRLRYVLKKGIKDNIRMLEDYKKFGNGSFVFGIVEYCSKESLLEREQYYYELWNPQYNVWKQVYNAKDREFTQEQLEYFKSYPHGPKDMKKHSDSLKQAWIGRKSKMTPDELKLSQSKFKGHKHTSEAKNKMSLKGKGRKRSMDTKIKIRERRLGTKLINGKFVKIDEVF